MEHRLITGGFQYLPFARSRIKALRAAGLTYASQQFEMGDASVKVRIEPGQEYITLSGGSGQICVLPNVAYATTVALDPGGVEMPRTVIPNSGGLLRIGTHSATGGVWGTSPFSQKNIEARLSSGGAGNTNVAVYVEDELVFTDTSEHSAASDPSFPSHWSNSHDTTNAVIGARQNPADVGVVLVAHTLNDLTVSSSGAYRGYFYPADSVYLSAFEGGVTAHSGADSSTLYISDYRLGTDGGKIKKANGSYELTYRSVPAKNIITKDIVNSTISFADLEPPGNESSNALTTSSSSSRVYSQGSFHAFTCLQNGQIYLGEQHVDLTSSGNQNTSAAGEPYYDTGSSTQTLKYTIKITSISASDKVVEDVYALGSTRIDKSVWDKKWFNATPVHSEITQTSTIDGEEFFLSSLIAGAGKLCIYYVRRTWPGAVDTEHIEVVGTGSWTKLKTIDLGGAYSLAGASSLQGNYIWTNRYCFNISKETFTEIPGFLNPNPSDTTVPNIEANYYELSHDGSTATYYWLNISNANRDKINAHIPLGYPLADGHFKKYNAKINDAGIVVVTDITPATNAIIGTSRSAASDLHGATLLFDIKKV